MLGINEYNLPGLHESNSSEGHQHVELFFGCRKLANTDVMSISDPKINVYKLLQNGIRSKIFETEMLMDTSNPDFTKSLNLDYKFETKQNFIFEVVDIDSNDGKSLILLGKSRLL
jgi:hypothetical protein